MNHLKSGKIRVLLDTNTLVKALAENERDSQLVLKSRKVERYTLEYVLKEFRRALTNRGFSQGRINRFVDLIHQECTVLPTPSSESFSRCKLSARSDRPIVASAVKAGCILVTHAHVLLKEARAYVEAMTARDLLEWKT